MRPTPAGSRSEGGGLTPLALAVFAGVLFGPGVACAGATAIAADDLVRLLSEQPELLVLDARGHAAYRERSLDGAMDVGSDPEGYLPDGRGGPVVLLVRPDWSAERRQRWVMRLEAARHEVYLLGGDPSAWRDAGLTLVVPEESYVRPGTVPFLIPRGLCETNEPAHRYR